MYKLLEYGVRRLRDGASIPPVYDNTDWQEYLDWKSAGGVPEPEYTPVELIEKQKQNALMAKMQAAAPAIRSIPNWATWTAQEAAANYQTAILDKIDAATTLAQMKAIVLEMAKRQQKHEMVSCYLRDHGGII